MMVTTKTTPATSSRGRRRPGSNSREAWPTPQLTPWKSSEGSSCRSRRRRRKGSAKRLLGESARGLLPTWTTAAALPTSTSGNALQRLPRPGACSSRASTRRSSCPRPSSRSRKRRRRRRCRRTRALLLLLLLPLPRRLRRRQFAPSPRRRRAGASPGGTSERMSRGSFTRSRRRAEKTGSRPCP